jgi:hypothetical protein
MRKRAEAKNREERTERRAESKRRKRTEVEKNSKEVSK